MINAPLRKRLKIEETAINKLGAAQDLRRALVALPGRYRGATGALQGRYKGATMEYQQIPENTRKIPGNTTEYEKIPENARKYKRY